MNFNSKLINQQIFTYSNSVTFNGQSTMDKNINFDFGNIKIFTNDLSVEFAITHSESRFIKYH